MLKKLLLGALGKKDDREHVLLHEDNDRAPTQTTAPKSGSAEKTHSSEISSSQTKKTKPSALNRVLNPLFSPESGSTTTSQLPQHPQTPRLDRKFSLTDEPAFNPRSTTEQVTAESTEAKFKYNGRKG